MFLRAVIMGVLLAPFLAILDAQTFQLLKVQTGPSGKNVGPTFVFDELRTRFIYPQDRSLIIYFEWKAPLGEHVLTATWIAPNGHAASISPEVRIQNTGTQMNAYWTFEIMPDAPGGLWSCDVRIDGQPAGSTAFELVMPASSATPVPPKAEHPAINDLYKRISSSVVWVYAIGNDGNRLDTSMGFIVNKDRVATSFDAIDSASSLDIELPNRAHVRTDKVIACSRLQNWAVIAADTGDTPPVQMGDPEELVVGQQILVFNVDKQSRLFGIANVTGTQSGLGSEQRNLLDGQLSPEASGAPVMNRDGKVLGLLTSGIVPAARFHERPTSAAPALWSGFGDVFAIPISTVQVAASSMPVTFEQLFNTHVFTRPLAPGLSFLWGGTTDQPLTHEAPSPRYVTEFRKNQTVWVEMLWEKNGKLGKGATSAQIYSSENKLVRTIAPKKLRLSSLTPTRVTFGFPVASLTPGIYRIDVLWEDAAVWRTFVQVVQ